jgi:rRNA maturation endonuclease Nob1
LAKNAIGKIKFWSFIQNQHISTLLAQHILVSDSRIIQNIEDYMGIPHKFIMDERDRKKYQNLRKERYNCNNMKHLQITYPNDAIQFYNTSP